MRPRATRPAQIAAFLLAAATAVTIVDGATADALKGSTARQQTSQARRMPSLWGVEVDRSKMSLLANGNADLLRAAGVNALVVDPGRVSRKQFLKIRRSAARKRFILVALMRPRASNLASRAVRSACRKRRRQAASEVCRDGADPGDRRCASETPRSRPRRSALGRPAICEQPWINTWTSRSRPASVGSSTLSSTPTAGTRSSTRRRRARRST